MEQLDDDIKISTTDNDEGLAANAHGLYDSTWNEARWREMAEHLVRDGIVTWREITTTILGELNPPQVGTSIASANKIKFGFKGNHARLHPNESFMPHVMRWFYERSGRCIDCGTRLDLQADHIDGRENYADPTEADLLSNLELRCRRHNVAKRKSHVARAGRTVLPAQQALMWILFEIRPVTKLDLARLCRIYGMTMAGIRFEEAWAMALWLEREGQYVIARENRLYDIIRWVDGSITRRFASDDPPPIGGRILAKAAMGDQILCFLASVDGTASTARYYEFPLDQVPFVYELGDREPTDIAIWPLQTGGTPLAPREMSLHVFELRAPDESCHLARNGVLETAAPAMSSFKGVKLARMRTLDGLSLVVH
ncbi:HNH endonuclease [Cellulosimicrobium sp. PMB13]|uniref:HNH endonuclease signature motif containing protein n=1 Tax=Cellulosimicrobium sp. PMB13 TaxID=3120158 RepID=UPI003F4CAA4B